LPPRSLSFYEFLEASGNGPLREVLSDPEQCLRLSPPLHRKALNLLSVYHLVDGLPEVVACWVREQDLAAVATRHRDLLATYRDDFNKYRERVSPELLRRVLESVPRQLGTKFVYRGMQLTLVRFVCALDGRPEGAERE